MITLKIDPKVIQHFLKLNTDELTPAINQQELSERYKESDMGLILQDNAIQTGPPFALPSFRRPCNRSRTRVKQTEYKSLFNTWYTKMNGGKYQHRASRTFINTG